jgi:hypothetical protein
MGLKTDNSLVDAQLSKMKVGIKNIASLVAVGNLAVNQLMEREATAAIIAKVVFAEEPKWTIVMAKNVGQECNRRSASLTCASRALKPKRARSKRSWCSSST